MNTDLSIIIVSYNVKEFLLDCLQSVFFAGRSLEMEVFVVDNASADGTVEEVQYMFPLVAVIANEKNAGFPRANNQALELCSGEIILLLNPDTRVHQNALIRLIGFFEEHSGGAVAGLDVRNADCSRQASVRAIPSAGAFLLASSGLRHLLPGSLIPGAREIVGLESEEAVTVGSVSGAALAFDRIVLDRIGMLDEDLFWIEDLDFCYRAHAAGFPVYFLPGALVLHHVGESAKNNIGRVVYHQHVSKVRFAKKHYGWTAGKTLEIMFLIQLSGKILVRSIQWILASQRVDSYRRIIGYIAACRAILREALCI